MSFRVRIEHNIIVATAMVDGLSASKMSKLLNLTHHTFSKHFAESLDGYTFKRKRKQETEPYIKGSRAGRSKDSDICERYLGGEILADIGKTYGVTRERIRQILKRYGITGKDGGKSKISADRHKKMGILKDAASDLLKQSIFGCSKAEWDYYRAMDDDYKKTPLGFYSMQKKNANQRNIEWNITMNEWWFIWTESGRWEERGLKKHGYVMARMADVGGYSLDNVHIVTLSENSAEYYMVYKEDWIEKMIKAHPNKDYSKTK